MSHSRARYRGSARSHSSRAAECRRRNNSHAYANGSRSRLSCRIFNAGETRRNAISQTRARNRGARRTDAGSVMSVQPNRTSSRPYLHYYSRSHEVRTSESRLARLVSLTSKQSTNASRAAIISSRHRFKTENRTATRSYGVRLGRTSADFSERTNESKTRRRPEKTRKRGYYGASSKRTRGTGDGGSSPDGSRRRSALRSHQTNNR